MATTTTTTTSSDGKKSPLALLAPLFRVLNAVALGGWIFVLGQLLKADAAALVALQPAVLGLEGICVLEVVRIVAGDLPGNVVLGVALHAIRLTVITLVWPNASPLWQRAILYSWAVTEVSRYPMYLYPAVNMLRAVRMVVPLVTFPVGAAAEAYATFLVWQSTESSRPPWQQGLLTAVLFVNGVLGPTMAYPALLKKGLPVLGLTKKKKIHNKKE